MAGFCEHGNEPSGSVRSIFYYDEELSAFQEGSCCVKLDKADLTLF